MMSELATPDAYGVLTEPAVLQIQRLLPGPIERVWRYLTESDLRARWLASGKMDLTVGAGFSFTWRNDRLTEQAGQRPEGFSEEHSMESRILAVEPLRKLVFTWGTGSEVSFELQSSGQRVLLTVTHRRLPSRDVTLMVGPGWHAHLDILAARLEGTEPGPFWDDWKRLKGEYEARLSV